MTTPTEVNESARTNSNASIDFPEVNAPPGQHDREYVSAYLKSGFPKTIYEKHLELRKIETELLKDNKAIVIAVVRYRGEKFDFKMKHLLYNTNGEWKIANIKMYFDK